MMTEPGRNPKEAVDTALAIPPEAVSAVRTARRRRFIGAAGGIGVLLSVQAKTALGQTCVTISGNMSGNTSPREGETPLCVLGHSPDYWRQPQNFSAWVNVIPPEVGEGAPLVCQSGVGNVDPSAFATRGTSVNLILPGAVGDAAIGVWEVLAFPSLYEPLIRHLLTAWLNAQGIVDYPLTTQQITDIWTQLSSGGTYCPPNITCSNGGMASADVVTYIESTYGGGDEPGDQDACMLATGETEETPPSNTGPVSGNGNGPGSNNGGGGNGSGKGKGKGGT